MKLDLEIFLFYQLIHWNDLKMTFFEKSEVVFLLSKR